MANKFKRMGGIKETEDGGFGTYSEEKGGGSPKGGIWGGTNGRVGWSKRENMGEVLQGEHREDQPRTDDGKFTYNSVNGKETKYESRGKTVNPLLTGGKNGIKIDEARRQFAAKSGELYEKYKDKWYVKGSEKIVKEGRKFKTVVAQHDVFEIARVSFDIKKGAFTYEDEAWSEKGKVGARSKAEKAARAEARKSGAETFVSDGAGGIARKPGTQMGGELTTGIPIAQVLPRLMGMKAIQNLVSGVTTTGVSSSGQIVTGAPGTLKGANKATMALNPSILSGLASSLGASITPPPAARTRKVSLSNFKKK